MFDLSLAEDDHPDVIVLTLLSIKILDLHQAAGRIVADYYQGFALFISWLELFLNTMIMPPLMIKIPPSSEPGVMASCKNSAAIIVAARGST